MKKSLALIAAAILATSSSQAAIIFQSQHFSNVTSGSSLVWNQFDSSLGTLTSIVFTLDGSITGSFSVTDTDSFSDVAVSSPNARLGLSFSGVGGPSPLQGTSLTFTTSPGTTSGSPFGVAGGVTQVFTVDPTPFALTSYTSPNLTASSAYFTGLSTFDTTVLRITGVTLVGGTSTQDFSSLLAQGTVGLTYTYAPSSAIPEPGTWAAAALLVGGAAFARWRKRKSA